MHASGIFLVLTNVHTARIGNRLAGGNVEWLEKDGIGAIVE
jgi:hypothetical protein